MPPFPRFLKKKITDPVKGLLQRAKDNSALGVAKNTILGLPQAAKQVVKQDTKIAVDAAKRATDFGAKLLPGIPRIADGVRTGNWKPYTEGIKEQYKFLSEPLTTQDPVTGKVTLNKENAEKRMGFVGGFTGGDAPKKIISALKSAADDAARGAAKSVPSEADRLIAQGKIRVVSRDGRDVYQTRQGDKWVNKRDETSAVAQASKSTRSSSNESVKESSIVSTKQPLLQPSKASGETIPKSTKNSSPDARNAPKAQSALLHRASVQPSAQKLPSPNQSSSVKINPKARPKGKAQATEQAAVQPPAIAKAQKEVPSSKESIPLRYSRPHLKYDGDGKALPYTPRQKRILERSPHTQLVKMPPSVGEVVKKRYLPLKRSEGEIRSFEKAAEAATSPTVPRVPRGLDPKIDKPQTPVTKKVNILDYVRTPDRVMRKIGLGAESDELRRAFDSYQKELPKNIEVITQWANLVKHKKGASERIFKYLDGQAITLDSQERLIAHEIKDWLADWADRLKLPPSARIRDYITHIFEDEIIRKEFDEDLAKIIADKVPAEVYDPFLQKRLGVGGYKQDAWAALDAYVKRATRKVHMDPALERIEVKANALEESQFDYVKSYIDRVNMRPTKWDNRIDNLIKSSPIGYKWGQRPTLAATRTLRQVVYRATLGLNPGSALRNLSQGANVYAKLGEKHTVLGYVRLLSKDARKELAESGVLENNFIQDRSLNATKKMMEKLDKSLFVFFDTAEKINRGAAYLGGKSKARSLGLKGADADEYAKEIVRKTQFNYDAIDTPAFLGSDIMKTLAQFSTYPIKQTEFLAELARNKEWAGLIRYAASGLVFVYTVGQALGMKPEELLPTGGFTRLLEEGPPAAQFAKELGGAVFNAPDDYGNERTLAKKTEDVLKAGLTTLVPAGTQIRKTWMGTEAVMNGGSLDKSGRLQYEVGGTPIKDAQAVIFGKSATPEAQEYYRKKEEPKEDTALDKAVREKAVYRNTKIRPIYNDVQRLVAEGREDEAIAIVDNLSDEDYEEYKKIKAAEKRRKTLETQDAMLPVYEKVQKLKEAGRIDEATAIVDGLTDEEYHAYTLLKKKLQ